MTDPLKNMLRALGLTEDEIEGDLKEKPCEKLYGQSPRYAMQTLGTEWGRAIMGENFWVKLVECQIAFAPGDIVIDDIRYDSEVQMVRRLGGGVINIRRLEEPKNPVNLHKSEAGCDYDILLGNYGPIEQMTQRLEKIVDFFHVVGRARASL